MPQGMIKETKISPNDICDETKKRFRLQYRYYVANMVGDTGFEPVTFAM